MIHAQLRAQGLDQDLEKLKLAGNSADLTRVLDACPMPCLLLSNEREVRRANHAFVAWLNIDPQAMLGQRLDNLMILRGPGMNTMWRRIFDEGSREERFNATYVSPGRVRTSQATAIGLAKEEDGKKQNACLVIFETLSGRDSS